MAIADFFRRSYYYPSSKDPDASAAERSAAADKRREEAESRRESERRWYAHLPIIAIATLCVAVTLVTGLLAVASQYTLPKVEAKPVTKEAEPKKQPAPPEKPPSAPGPVSMNLKSKELFGYNSSALRVVAGSAQRELDACLQPHLTRVYIIGHADCIGSDEYNLGLSERRAVAVKRYLTENGVDAALIITEGRGAALSKAEPICTTVLHSTATNRAQLEPFRRVDVTCECARLAVQA